MRARTLLITGTIIFLWGGWLWLVIAYGQHTQIEGSGQALPFQISGAFGDSFGGIASFMATLAAAGALMAFVEQRESNARQNFESNFFSLLSHFQDIVNQLDVESIKKTTTRTPTKTKTSIHVMRKMEGRDAIRRMLALLREGIDVTDFSNVKIICKKYDLFYAKWADDLGHYFRILYHIIRMIDEKCPGDKIYYTRLVRAHLSSSEIALISYNLVCGEGREKFVEYAEKYALLHNFYRSDDPFLKTELSFFCRKIGSSAFRFKDLPPVTY